jgi:hypothetical protein
LFLLVPGDGFEPPTNGLQKLWSRHYSLGKNGFAMKEVSVPQ